DQIIPSLGETGVVQVAPGQWQATQAGVPTGRAVFPAPSDPTGDVKNLLGSPGGNDSIWLDLGYPVMYVGRKKVKPLFAFVIVDLDNRININVVGNLKAGGTHGSNQGWGKWEVSPAQVMTQGGGTEWRNLFLGSGSIRGRYGPDNVPSSGPASNAQPLTSIPPFYSRIDYDGAGATGPIALPGQGGQPGFSAFPGYGAGYGNATPASGELNNHPLTYNYWRPGWPPPSDDPPPPSSLPYGRFTVDDMKRLLYYG